MPDDTAPQTKDNQTLWLRLRMYHLVSDLEMYIDQLQKGVPEDVVQSFREFEQAERKLENLMASLEAFEE